MAAREKSEFAMIRSLVALLAFAFVSIRASEPMTDADRVNLERNLRWMLERERASSPTASNALVGVYADAGVWHVGAKSIVDLLEGEGVACRVLDRSRLTEKELNGLETLVLPGGWAPLQRDGARASGLAAIEAFVKRGGRCVGICAGAYLLSQTVRYDERDYPYPIGLFDGTAVGPVPKLAAFPKPGSAKWTATDAGKKIGLEALGENEIYYSGGPCFVGGTNATVLARYHDGSAAAISKPVGKGDIILLGAHLERPIPPQGDDAAAPKFAGKVFKALVKGNVR